MKMMRNKLTWVFVTLFIFGLSTAYAQNATTKPIVVNLNDEEYKDMTLDKILKKYKGQVIYLDFWASWCGPCKKEMPFSQSLKSQFTEKDVVFVYISTDKNAEQWKGMIEQLEISGQNYLANPAVKQEIVERFNLQFIPRYVLINKEGKVVDANAKRPSDPAVASDIEKLLL